MPLLVAVLAQRKIVLVVARCVAPLNVRFGKSSKGWGCGRNRVRFMAIIAPGNCLGLS